MSGARSLVYNISTYVGRQLASLKYSEYISRVDNVGYGVSLQCFMPKAVC